MRAQAMAFILTGALLSSCAFTPHTVAVTADAPTSPSSVGEGATVLLKVVDDRDEIVVGQRGVGMRGADITVAGVVPALEREFKEGLEAKGFTVVPVGAEADSAGTEVAAEFEARLRSFKFFIESGFWSGAENTSVAINVEAKKHGREFERGYRSDDEERTMVIPAGDTIDKKLNASLTIVLAKIMSDEELIEFLAQ